MSTEAELAKWAKYPPKFRPGYVKPTRKAKPRGPIVDPRTFDPSRPRGGSSFTRKALERHRLLVAGQFAEVGRVPFTVPRDDSKRPKGVRLDTGTLPAGQAATWLDAMLGMLGRVFSYGA